ncbi:MAG: hypothetical protein GXO31_06635 [Epsilonproteobacteria bacterium]|nr:hypothetical protein [Campylobacterota bacterium]
MKLLTFMSFIILTVTILTMVFGIIAYFLYKARERKKFARKASYEEILTTANKQTLFFKEKSFD